MAKKFDSGEEVQRRAWTGEVGRLPMKYHPAALMPCQVTRADSDEWEYLTTDGTRVKLRYVGVFDNTKGRCAAELETKAQELYGISLAAIEAVWGRRVGRLDGWWQIVHLTKVNATDAK